MSEERSDSILLQYVCVVCTFCLGLAFLGVNRWASLSVPKVNSGWELRASSSFYRGCPERIEFLNCLQILAEIVLLGRFRCNIELIRVSGIPIL